MSIELNQKYPSYNNLDGLFELHVTVDCSDVGAFSQFCQKMDKPKLKPVVIELPYGENQKQVMTSNWVVGSYEKACGILQQVTKLVSSQGYSISRSKIEALASTKGVPETSEQVTTFPESNYFEFHAKVVIPDEKMSRIEELSKLALSKNAHLSKNGLKQEKPGLNARFVNLRVSLKPKNEAFKLRDELVQALNEADWQTEKVQSEYVVYDSNLKYDQGWM